MSIEEINKMVMKKYPKKKKEDTCMDCAQRREGLRWAYRRRLMNEYGFNDIKKSGVN